MTNFFILRIFLKVYLSEALCILERLVNRLLGGGEGVFFRNLLTVGEGVVLEES